MVVVTGAARGIGAAIALELAAHGHALVLCDRDADVDGTAREARRRGDVAVRALRLDVSAEEDAAALGDVVGALADGGEPLAGVVNNAGIGGWGLVEAQPAHEWTRIVDVNLKGAYLVTRASVPILKAQRAGAVINILSDSAEHGFERRTAYCASKYALRGFSDALREELREYAVRVSAVYVSRVDTHFNGSTPTGDPRKLRPEDVARAVSFILAQPSDVEIREIKLGSTRSSYGPYH